MTALIQVASSVTYYGSSQGLSSVPTDLIPQDVLMVKLDRNVLEIIGDHIFSTFTDLTSLDLSHNNIGVISPTAFCGTKITHLYLNNNSLTSLPNLDCIGPTLQKFYATDNQITYWDELPFRNATQLNYLSLRHNKIRIVTGNAMKQAAHVIEYMDLPINQISSIPPEFFTNMQVLNTINLNDNFFLRLPDFSHLPSDNNLLHLYIGGNRLITITAEDLENLPNLQTLYVTHNDLSVVPPARILPNYLRILHIDGNPIFYIPEDTFLGLRLQNLNVGNTKLQRLPPVLCLNRTLEILHAHGNNFSSYTSNNILSFLKTMSELTNVNFADSSLSSFPNIRQLGRNFSYLRFMTQHKMVCDCNLAWYKDTNSLPSFKSPSSEQNYQPCFSPAHLREKTWAQITPEELLCHSEYWAYHIFNSLVQSTTKVPCILDCSFCIFISQSSKQLSH